MDFNFNEEQLLTQNMIKDLAQKELAPGMKERMEKEEFPREITKLMAENGLLGLNVAEEYGGNPQDTVTIGIIMEEMSKWAHDAAFLIFNVYSQNNFVNMASEEVKQEWLPAIAKGEKIIVMGATEADAGSDLSGLKATARLDGDDYIINGEKNRASFAHQADAVLVLARTDPKSKGVTPFLVPLDLPGVTTARIADIGGESTSGGIVSLEDVRIPKKYMLSDAEGKGFAMAMRNFDCIRVFLSLQSLGMAAVSVEESCEYVKQRFQFGKPIAKFEGTSFRLAEAATKIEMARWLCYKCLWMKDNNIRHTKESAMVKWFCPRVSFEIIHECLLIHGHYGYSKDLPFEQRLRDVIGNELGDGSAEIMKMIVARELIGREALPY